MKRLPERVIDSWKHYHYSTVKAVSITVHQCIVTPLEIFSFCQSCRWVSGMLCHVANVCLFMSGWNVTFLMATMPLSLWNIMESRASFFPRLHQFKVSSMSETLVRSACSSRNVQPIVAPSPLQLPYIGLGIGIRSQTVLAYSTSGLTSVKYVLSLIAVAPMFWFRLRKPMVLFATNMYVCHIWIVHVYVHPISDCPLWLCLSIWLISLCQGYVCVDSQLWSASYLKQWGLHTLSLSHICNFISHLFSQAAILFRSS